jgi:Leucine-rich repeat (LRR) protein
LEYLDISYNKIEKVSDGWTGHPNIKFLKGVDNKFKNLAPFKDMPKLEELYLASNVVTNIIGYETMPKLKKLHLRKNRIEKIDDEMPPLDSIEYLNLRGNKVPNLE